MQYQSFFAFLLLLGCGFIEAPLLRAERIAGPIRNNQRVRLKGHVPTQASADNDEGAVDPSMVLHSITLVLKPTTQQQADLDKFLEAQQDPSSPDYHHWLTPEEFASRFGVSQDDIQKIADWGRQQNLTVTGMGRGRNWISFSGKAVDVQKAFGAEIHHYTVNGKRHYANAVEPSLPVALDAVVRTIRGLNDFRMKPRRLVRREIPPGSQSNYTSATSGNHYLAPDDIAAIYNLKPLYAGGIDGTGQKLVVVGQSQIQLDDLQQYRTRFNLPGGDPQVMLVPNTRDPGISSGDLGEADLDLELAGAVARKASLIYVYSYDVSDAIQYAIDQNLAPVLTTSYGLCEAQTSPADAQSMQALARQANAQGITWFAASGDSGGADCYTGSSRSPGGAAVDLPAGIPEVTGVGGTVFNEGSATYWNATNGPNGDSVTSYIPESVWNDSTDGNPSASGGGASTYFSKPSWQTGPGVPADGARSVPDVSLASSADHDGYLIYSEGKLQVIGGTSVAAPSLAGMAALINHRLVASGAQASPGLGNINPKLYSLAQTNPSVFHDIVAGDNKVTIVCSLRSRNCTPGTYGFDAGTGYDMATGLGSVDAYQLVTSWNGAAAAFSKGNSSMALAADTTAIVPGDRVLLIATLSSGNGGTPTGSVTFTTGGAALGTVPLDASGTATLQVSASLLTPGGNTVSAQYAGDASYNQASASIAITLVAQVSSGPPSIASAVNGASFQPAYAPGMIVTLFGSQLAPAAATAAAVPLPGRLAGVSATVNGYPAPLYFVSPGQINLQVPYEVTPGTRATLALNNNGRTTTSTFQVAPAAPAVFTDQHGAIVPSTGVARNQIATLYLTGAGAVSPGMATGAAPSAGTPVGSLPRPVQRLAVTVGGIPAAIQFAGIPVGLAGVAQINFLVPTAVAPGVQPVVVSIGQVSSPAASLTVTP